MSYIAPGDAVQTKKLIATGLKVALSATLLGYLGWRAYNDPSFRDLAAAPKNWPVLVCAVPICLMAVLTTILRWRLLVRTLGLEFTPREAIRAGFLGYAFNLIPVGLVAGDSVKAVMLIHKNPRRKTEAVTTVLVDRVIGLYALLLLAAVATILLPAQQIERLAPADHAIIVNLCTVVRMLTLVSTAGLVVMWLPGVTESRLWDRLEHTPLVGTVLHKLVAAMRAYRQRFDVLLTAIAMSLCIHLLYVSSFVLMTMSVGISPSDQPPAASIFVIVPPSMIARALPIGVYEITITLLFRVIAPAGAPPNMGLLIALADRLIQVTLASIGVGFWLTSRTEVRDIMHEAEETPEAAGA
jgi:glycosyltransferase 2 family protein